MSTTIMNIHGASSIEISQDDHNGTKWVHIVLTDEDGGTVSEVTVFDVELKDITLKG